MIAWRKIWKEITIPSAYDYHLLNIGFNDARRYGNTIAFPIGIAHEIANIIAYLRLGQIWDSASSSISRP